MNSSSRRAATDARPRAAAPRVRVLRGVNPELADLGTVRAAAARHLVVDPQLVADAHDDGYRAGYDAGFSASLIDAAAAIDSRERSRNETITDAIARLNEAAETLAAVHARAIDEIERKVITIAFDIACELVGHELEEPEGRGRDALQRALNFAPASGPVVARLHPDDAATAGELDALTVNQLTGGRSLTLIADPSLAPGDCVVDIDATRIDGRIQPAIDRIREVIWG